MSDSKFEIVDGVLKKYTGTEKEVIIPEGVVEIGDGCFTDAHFMEVITLPSTLRKINYSVVATDYAGYEYALKKVNVDSLDTWMNIEFKDNKANFLRATKEVELYINNQLVTDLVIPGKYKVVKANSFFGYKKLKSVTFEEGVEVIEKGSFVRSGIEKVKLPKSIKDLIGESYSGFFGSPFQYCEDLKEINIPNNLKVLPDNFLDGASIEKIELPEGLEVIPAGCFNACKHLKEINIPNSVHTVKEHAFYSCDALEELIFPDSVHLLGTMSLANIKKIILPEDWNYTGNKYWSLFEYTKMDKLEMNQYDNAFYIGSRTNPYQVLLKAVNKDIESCYIHEDCKYICGYGNASFGNSGFYECKKLKTLSIPEGIKRIEFNALGKCDSLENVDLPPSYGMLDPKVYDGSNNLKFKEYGVVDRIIYFEKEIKESYEIIKEQFGISRLGINLVSSKTSNSDDIITIRFKKNNKVSKERLIAILSSLNKAKEMKEEDYLSNSDVYKVTYPINKNNNENITKYVLFDEDTIYLVYSLISSFVGKYFLINTHYKDVLVAKRFKQRFDIDEIRKQIEIEFERYDIEQLANLLIEAKNKGDYLDYEKINLYMNKLKNNGEWDRNYGEE